MTSRRTCSNIVAVVATLVIGIPHGGTESPAAIGGPGDSKPVAIHIEIGDRSELVDLTRLVSIEDVRGREVLAVATPEQLVRLHEAGYGWRILPHAVKAEDVTMCPPGWEDNPDRPWSCYPTYDQYTAIMHRFASDHPTLCRIVDLGAGNNAVRPHRLWAVVISDNPDTDEAEPEVLLTSTMHGDETTGYVLMLRLIDHLLVGYGTETEITALVDKTEIWINPLANPDGAYRGADDSVDGAIRNYTTTSGDDSWVNPNRNFPDFVLGDHPDGFAWWPETEAMMVLAGAKTFVLSANFHGGVEVVNYPWDTVERRHPDDLWFQTLARDWVDLAQDDSPGGYMTDFENGITNGYDWYPINGGRQDFMTFFHGGREVTIELSRTKLLPADELDDMWLWNRRALLDYIAHAHEGIRGVVTDPNGTPLEATIEVVGIDREEDGSMVRTDPAVGDFHRLLLPGLYDLRIEAADFQPREIQGIAVVNGEATTVDVVLYRELVRRPSRRLAPQP
ncbi:MAG: carboxypeptidase regulatory-like domain-containing protein [Acidobacteria bacterium]|nr:carboxypeptidase regulatory-like domain-containing protein [Candidatus Sulfomarinibacter sp. MAG AM1]